MYRIAVAREALIATTTHCSTGGRWRRFLITATRLTAVIMRAAATTHRLATVGVPP
jgi:hypothetical protein